jgi:hypothetical protein
MAGFSGRTARRIDKDPRLPSQKRQPRTWRTRTDPLTDVWPRVLEMLKIPGMMAVTIFEDLQDRDYARGAKAAATQRAYAADWRHYTAWCRRKELEPLPPHPQVVGSNGGSSAISWNCAQRGQPLDRADRHIAEVMSGRDPRPRSARPARPRYPADRVRRRPAPQRNHRSRLRARPHRGRRRLDRIPGPGPPHSRTRQDGVARGRDRPWLETLRPPRAGGATAARLMEESTKAREPSPMPLRRSPGVVTITARVPIRSRKATRSDAAGTRAGHDGRQVRAESINKDAETAALQ